MIAVRRRARGYNRRTPRGVRPRYRRKNENGPGREGERRVGGAQAMRRIDAQALTHAVAAIMQSAGSQPGEAATIARRLVDSNLAGHESHGVILVGKYLEWVQAGWLRPNQQPSVVAEADGYAIVDGNRGFGQVVGEQAMQLGIDKAARTGIALVGLRNCGHLGRVGDWAEMAAQAGQVSLHFLNTSGAQRVAPYGGSDRRLSTNPISIGVPIDGDAAVILDITTSMVAEGKLMVAMNKGEHVPDGWIVDAQGTPTTDPAAFYAGGALRTIAGHKGSGLAIVTDLLAGAISTGRSSDPDDPVLRNNMLSIFIAPALYDPQGGVLREARRLVDWVKASPPADPAQPVLVPGEIERSTRAERLARGVPLDARTCEDLLEAAHAAGLPATLLAALRA
jgi:uncharacterized oxidoreductase